MHGLTECFGATGAPFLLNAAPTFLLPLAAPAPSPFPFPICCSCSNLLLSYCCFTVSLVLNRSSILKVRKKTAVEIGQGGCMHVASCNLAGDGVRGKGQGGGVIRWFKWSTVYSHSRLNCKGDTREERGEGHSTG